MRPRRADLRRRRRHRRAIGHAVLLFKDLDENKPTGSIRISVETIDYFLRRYREEVIRKRKAEDIEAQLAALEAHLRREKYGSEYETEMPPAMQESWESEEVAGD